MVVNHHTERHRTRFPQNTNHRDRIDSLYRSPLEETLIKLDVKLEQLRQDLNECRRLIAVAKIEQFHDPDETNIGSLSEAMMGHVLKVLALCSWNKMKAARILGINVKTVYNYIQRAERPGGAL